MRAIKRFNFNTLIKLQISRKIGNGRKHMPIERGAEERGQEACSKIKGPYGPELIWYFGTYLGKNTQLCEIGPYVKAHKV